MKKIKSTSVAGTFYIADKEELLKQLEKFKHSHIKDCDYHSRAILVPHAGYMYSGEIASEGFQYLDKNVKNIFIIAPAHRVAVSGIALSDYDAWQTPLGEIPINQKINEELIEKFDCEYYDEAFEDEHAVEVEIPFIQTILEDVKIIPILVGNSDCIKIAKIIEHYWQNKENAFVISSDLSHFYESSEAKKIDSLTAEMIESNDIQQFQHIQACNSVGVCSIVHFAKDKNFSLIRVDLKNSGDVTSEKSRVVGYGAWFLYEGEKTEFIKRYFSDLVLDICKNSILNGIHNRTITKFDKVIKLPAVFEEQGASFITLEKNNTLRGCIGSIIPHQSLVDDLTKNAYNSAFEDPRFLPLKPDEFDDLSIAISLLSTPTKMDFIDQSDLLEKIEPFVDGIIIKDKGYQAVYLPSVWEQLPDKEMFLKSLKIKAGLNPDHFSKTFEAYRFRTEYIKS